MRMRRVVVFIGMATLVHPRWAGAQSPPASPTAPAAPAKPAGAPADGAAGGSVTQAQRDEARSRYTRGVELFNDGDYKLALIEFERAYELVPNFQVFYNIGQVNSQLNNYAKALKAFEAYLEQGGDQVPAARRTEVEASIQVLRSRTAFVTITANVPDAEVSIDDVVVGRAPITRQLVDAGQHRVQATAPGRNAMSRTISLASGDDGKVALELSEIAVIRVGSAERPVDKPTYYWVGWTTAGVFAVASAVTGGLALSSYNDYNEAKKTPADAVGDPDGSIRRRELDDEASKTKTFTITTIALGGAAVVAAGATLYFTLRDRGSIRASAQPGGLRLVGTF